MPTSTDVALQPITDADLGAVAAFFHEHLNQGLSADRWARSMRPSWSVAAPNYGFLLRRDGQVVGANLAFYSRRTVAGRTEEFCNIAALCVLEPYRPHTFRLVRALLGQRRYTFTDFSPSGNVVELDRKLGFGELDTTTWLVPNLWWPPSRTTEVVTDLGEIETLLDGRDLDIFRDHREALAARHVVLRAGEQLCYVIFRKVRRKRLPLFASILYVSDAGAYRQAYRHLGSYLLRRHGAVFTLAERRIAGAAVRPALTTTGRPKMFKSKTVTAGEVDDLYSELVAVPW